ncbi:hypothetical protein QL285_019527 [Trifolium repens]|nr:hypothetical protein QL285_019527 [Trifolium repens]
MLLLLPLTLLVSLHHTPPKQQRTERIERKKRSPVSATTTEPPPREFEAAAKHHCLRPPFHLLSLTQSDDSGEPPLTSYSQTIQIQGIPIPFSYLINGFEKKGFYLKGLKFLNVERAFAEKHYDYSQ